jgi:signal transduction histidine kinase
MAAEPKLRTLAQLTRELVLMRLDENLEEVFLQTISRARRLLGAHSVIALYYDSDSEQLQRWECFGDGRAPARSEVPPAEVRAWIALGATEKKEILSPGSDLCRLLGHSRILSVRFPSGVNCARLLALDAANAGRSALDDFAEFGVALAPLLDRLYAAAHIRQQAIEEERNRVAQDFHDGPLQTLLALNIQLEFIRHIMGTDPAWAATEIEQLQATLRSEVRELREMLQEMRPIDLNRMGLTGLLRQLADDFQKSSGLSVKFICGNNNGPEPAPRVGRELFQIVREAASNARKHGSAHHIVITTESNSEAFRVSIDDDGVGFPFFGRHDLRELDDLRIGPVSIKQRVHRIGARLEIESNPGHGCRLLIVVPQVAGEASRAAAAGGQP